MSVVDAMKWLDDHGGRWFVSATASSCSVVASVGGLRAVAAARTLDLPSVQGALVHAVLELCAGAAAA